MGNESPSQYVIVSKKKTLLSPLLINALLTYFDNAKAKPIKIDAIIPSFTDSKQ